MPAAKVTGRGIFSAKVSQTRLSIENLDRLKGGDCGLS